MMTWIDENWCVLLIGIAYMAERGQWWTSHVRSLLQVVAESIECRKGIPTLGVSDIIAADIDQAIKTPLEKTAIDSVLDVVQPKDAPRVSVGRKIGTALVKLLPLISRVL